jgi:hypothetical protein
METRLDNTAKQEITRSEIRVTLQFPEELTDTLVSNIVKMNETIQAYKIDPSEFTEEEGVTIKKFEDHIALMQGSPVFQNSLTEEQSQILSNIWEARKQ